VGPTVKAGRTQGQVAAYAAIVQVPHGCSWQWLSVEIRDSGPQPLETTWVDDIAVARAD
jgi:hypothetical protein